MPEVTGATLARLAPSALTITGGRVGIDPDVAFDLIASMFALSPPSQHDGAQVLVARPNGCKKGAIYPDPYEADQRSGPVIIGNQCRATRPTRPAMPPPLTPGSYHLQQFPCE